MVREWRCTCVWLQLSWQTLTDLFANGNLFCCDIYCIIELRCPRSWPPVSSVVPPDLAQHGFGEVSGRWPSLVTLGVCIRAHMRSQHYSGLLPSIYACQSLLRWRRFTFRPVNVGRGRSCPSSLPSPPLLRHCDSRPRRCWEIFYPDDKPGHCEKFLTLVWPFTLDMCHHPTFNCVPNVQAATVAS